MWAYRPTFTTATVAHFVPWFCHMWWWYIPWKGLPPHLEESQSRASTYQNMTHGGIILPFGLVHCYASGMPTGNSLFSFEIRNLFLKYRHICSKWCMVSPCIWNKDSCIMHVHIAQSYFFSLKYTFLFFFNWSRHPHIISWNSTPKILPNS